MFKTIQILFVLCTALAVGVVQAVGVNAGFLCTCTGQHTVAAICEMDECHPQQVHADGCGQRCTDHHDTDAGCCEHEHPNESSDNDHDHEHLAVLDSLDSTPFSSSADVPPVQFVMLLAVSLVSEIFVVAPERVEPCQPPRPPDDTGPPMSVLVAETTVLLV
jgi:hypothetical protein